MASDLLPTRRKYGGHYFKETDRGLVPEDADEFEDAAAQLLAHISGHPDDVLTLFWSGKPVTVKKGDNEETLWQRYLQPAPETDAINRARDEQTDATSRAHAEAMHAETSAVIADSPYQFTPRMAPVTGKMNPHEEKVRRIITYGLSYLNDTWEDTDLRTPKGQEAMRDVLNDRFPESDNPEHTFVHHRQMPEIVGHIRGIQQVGWDEYVSMSLAAARAPDHLTGPREL